MTKTILVRDWRKMEIIAEPDAEHGRRKKDSEGNVWEWVAGGKRITAKKVV